LILIAFLFTHLAPLNTQDNLLGCTPTVDQ
jgi:hypothetical protein